MKTKKEVGNGWEVDYFREMLLMYIKQNAPARLAMNWAFSDLEDEIARREKHGKA